jgi:methionyl aminopeptidase
MIPIKTCQEIDKMRRAGHILAEVMVSLSRKIQIGASTIDLDNEAARVISGYGVKSAFKGYHGYPANICASVNEEVVHGIPGKRKLLEGDIIGIDIGIEQDGFFADMAKTFPVGKVEPRWLELIEVTRLSLEEAIRAFRPDHRLSDISFAVQSYCQARGFSVVRDFVGHGIGRELHEPPQIPNFTSGKDIQSPVLRDGMVFAIEPMINLGGWAVEVLKDGWTAVTKDRSPSAHFEHTVALLNGVPEILTQ